MPQKIQRITSTDSITLTSAYMKDIRRYPLISREEEIELVTKIRQGDKRAKDKLVTSNLRFVITVAKQYQYKGLELADLISAGNIGLIEAVDKYEPTKCFRFINHCWINLFLQNIWSTFSRYFITSHFVFCDFVFHQ